MILSSDMISSNTANSAETLDVDDEEIRRSSIFSRLVELAFGGDTPPVGEALSHLTPA
jgi:hypothetical protein